MQVSLAYGEIMKKKRFRFLNKIYASIKGYFWLPCPICGEMFGGHEWGGSLMTTPYSGKGVCPDCKGKAVQMNIEKFGISTDLVLDRKKENDVYR